MNEDRASRVAFWPGVIFVTLLSAALLSIGIAKPWRLLHEDNGAFFTSLALSHERLGLEETRGYGLFYDPHTGERIIYAHHPPGLSLLLAAAFSLTRSASPAVARSLAAGFQLASLWIFLFLLRQFVGPAEALLGGALFAVLPMGAFFGRMVGLEAFTLLAVMVQLGAWVSARREPSRRALALLSLGIVLGGFLDWSALFFTAAIFSAEWWQWRKVRDNGVLLGTIVLSAAGIVVIDFLHLWYAGHGTLSAVRQLTRVGSTAPGRPNLSVIRFVGGQIDNYRRYFSITGLASSLLCAGSLILPASAWGKRFLGPYSNPLGRRFLGVTLLAASAYVLAAPRWAKIHSYWQFFFLPFAVTSLLLALTACWQAGARSHKSAWRALFFLMVLEVAATSIYVLRLRHTRPGDYAVAKSREIERTFLSP